MKELLTILLFIQLMFFVVVASSMWMTGNINRKGTIAMCIGLVIPFYPMRMFFLYLEGAYNKDPNLEEPTL